MLVARDGSAIAIQDSAAPIQDRNGQVVGAVMVFHDVRQERQLHRRLAYLASHDPLTGFINRRELEERLSTVLAAVKAEPGKTAALLYMDLDQFKVVNDTCGHSAGDLLLRQLADVLRARVPKTGALARLGGDEFAVLLPDHTLATAAAIAESLREAIAAFRFSWRDNALQVGVSIGIVPVEAVERDRGDADERGGRRVLRREGPRPQPHPRLRGRRRGRASSRDAVGRAHQQGARRGALRAVLPADRADRRRRRALAALRAAAADARRARRDRRADGVHSGRRALQPDAGTRPLGHQPHARDARVPRRSRARRRTRSRSTCPAPR